MPGQDSTGAHRSDLRLALRRHRRRTGRSALQAARAAGWTPARLHRVEAFDESCSPDEVAELLRSYDTPPAEIERWLRIAARLQGDRPALVARTPQFRQFLELEQACDGVQQWQPLIVPGLLQTEAYAFAALAQGYGLTGDDARRIVDTRLWRQRLLTLDPGPDLRFIVDESVLHRPVASDPDVMPGQLARLAAVLRDFVEGRSRTQLSLLPTAAGLAPGLAGPFILVESDRHEDAVFLETALGDQLLRDDADDVRHYRLALDRLEELALSPEQSLERIVGLLA